MTEEDNHIRHIIESAYLKQGGNLRLGKKSKKLTDNLNKHGIQSGIEYAQSGGKIKFGKLMKKVAKSPVTKELVHLGVRTGLAYATDGLSEVWTSWLSGGGTARGRKENTNWESDKKGSQEPYRQTSWKRAFRARCRCWVSICNGWAINWTQNWRRIHEKG
jgi:hypothetical protein